MKTFAALCTALALASTPFSALAADAELSKSYASCMDKSGGVTMGMIECMSAEHKRQDARLNTAYKALMADLQPARKSQLQQAQRIWIQFRDANCGFYLDPEGGTMARVAANSCVMAMTAERANELENFKQP